MLDIANLERVIALIVFNRREILLDIIVLLLISSYYFWHGLYPLLTGKPCIKANDLRKVIIYFLIIELVIGLISIFLVFVALYGGTYEGITIGDSSLYFLVLVYSALMFMLWFFYRWESENNNLKHSISLLAISPEYALPAVYDTLREMNINYQKVISGFEIPDRDIVVKVILAPQKIYFSVDRPLDKMFLNQFCKKYQTIYKSQNYPISKRFCWLDNALGLMNLILSIFSVSYYAFVLYDIVLHSMAVLNLNLQS